MKKFFWLGFLLMVPIILSSSSLNDEVNVFIGTGGIGFGVGSTTPDAAVPFGAVRLGPDTAWNNLNPIFAHNVGYWYIDNQIRGFSHTHLSGIGVTDYGNIRFMPAIGRPEKKIDQRGYISKFRHEDESARPGYYSVVLEGSKIKAELTATTDAGFHRYAYPSGKNALLIVDLGRLVLDSYACGAEIKIDPEKGEISGWQKVCGSLTKRPGGVKFYFFAKLSEPVKNFGIAEKGKLKPGTKQTTGTKIAAYFDFGALSRPLLAKTGISLISAEQARMNLDAQIPDWDFEKVRTQAENLWAAPLSKIEIKGGSKDHRSIFYSALYHSYMMPTDFTEQGGNYLGFDNKTHQADWGSYYSDFSIWDTFRNLHPLLVLLDPQKDQDMMQSLTKMAEQGGFLPRWPTANVYTNCMTGTYADCLIADGYIKGLKKFDADTAFEKMLKVANEPTPKDHPYTGRPGILDYKKLGYLPSEKGPASSTLEYAYCDFCIAQMAAEMGKEQTADEFYKRSGFYKNNFDKSSGYFRPRKSNGKFQTPFFPTLWGFYYTEGDAWQWLWTNWYDPEGMAALFGGKEKMVAKLETFFKKVENANSDALPHLYYWHGNEPDMHVAYMFDQLGRPELTQKWVRWVINTKYENNPGGLPGNDDCGTMSAWFIFSALGFYPLAGTDIYYLTSPLFSEATIHLAKDDLVIKAPGAPEKIYIKSVKLNGKEINRAWIRHGEIVGGGELVFELSDAPTDWAKDSPVPEFRIKR